MKLTERKLRGIIREEMQRLNEKPKFDYEKEPHEHRVASIEVREFMENLADYLGVQWETKHDGNTIFAKKKKMSKKIDDGIFLREIDINMRPRVQAEVRFYNGYDDLFAEERKDVYVWMSDYELPATVKVHRTTAIKTDSEASATFQISSPNDARKFFERGKNLAKEVMEQQ